MYKLFNMGHRLEIYLDEKYAEEIISISNHFDIDARVIGYVEGYEGKQVTIKSENGEFIYQ